MLLALGACADHPPLTETAASFAAGALNFVVPVSVDLGAAPSGVVVADLDGDGHPDLAAATGARGVTVALARDGGFAPPRAFPAGNATNLVAGDFNGDDEIDLAVTNEAGVTVLLGKGDGSFGEPLSFATKSVPASIAVGDFDRDGKLDVAVAGGSGGQVAVLLGKGDGSFGAATTYATLPWKSMLATGDVDGNGKLDLLVANVTGEVVTLFGNGDGTFRSGPTKRLSQWLHVLAIAAGDFDGDGKLDLAIAWLDPSPDHLGAAGVALGNGDGTFRGIGSTPAFNRSQPKAVALADVDGDGKLDLIANIAHDSVVVTSLNKGDGTLGAIAYHRAAGPLLAAADLDGDGRADVLAASGTGVAVSAGNGDGTLHAPRAFEVSDESGGILGRIAIGDFNRDGFADVAVTYNDTTIAHIDVLLGDARGGLQRGSSIGLGDSSERWELDAVDVDGDGILDLVYASELLVLLGKGDGTFRQAYRDGRTNASAMTFGDFDGDGKLDAALCLWRQNGITILPGKGDGTFAKDRPIQIATDGPAAAIAAADLDGDGHTDLVVSTGGSLLVILGKGDGTFASPRPVAGAPGAASIATADLDGDGRIDLVLAGGDVTAALINTDGGTFRITETVPSSGKLRVADVDGDGIPDVLLHGGMLAVHRGKGDGTFEVGRVYGFGGRDFGVGDIDGDARLDVVSSLTYLSPFVAVLRNASR
ncbi:Putative aggregation factor core protein MAFp3, isoform C [Minicystis rosea]|nr:Putative aggregation factor core protein MAFp3, isoform C [Minicystis rosea]